MGTPELRSTIFNDVAMLGVRLVMGAIFIAHGLPKFSNPGFGGFLESLGAPAAMHYPVAAGEFVPGILLIAGVLSRPSSAVIAAIMLGAIFAVHLEDTLAGEDDIEFPLMLLVSALFIMVAGPGRLSAARLLGRIPRFLH